jgi:hypothetical protein
MLHKQLRLVVAVRAIRGVIVRIRREDAAIRARRMPAAIRNVVVRH